MTTRTKASDEVPSASSISRRDLLAGAAALGGMAIVGTLAGASTAQAQVADEPLEVVRYDLTIDGHLLARFDDLVEITSEVLVTRSRLPGKRTPPTVTLKRGMTRNIEMSAWHELVILGDVAAARRSLSMTAYDAAGDPVARYHLTDAWPSKVEIGGLRAGEAEVMTETVTLTAEFIQRVSV